MSTQGVLLDHDNNEEGLCMKHYHQAAGTNTKLGISLDMIVKR